MKSPNDFRVLLVYPNLSMMLVPPTAIALFTGILRRAGYTVDLFDSTHYITEETSSPQKRVKYLQARPFSEKDLGVKPKTDLIGDFVAKVDSFRPDLLVVSVVEDTFRQALTLLDSISAQEIPTIMGGVFVTAAPDRVMSFPQIRMIGVGEGERTVLEVADRVRTGRSCEDVPNVWVKRSDGTIIRNPYGPLTDINKPFPDYSLFDESRFYRPMGGRIFKTVPLETFRGCPYQCTFCNSPMHVDIAEQNALGNFMRRKPMERLREEIAYLIECHNPEYFYIIDDSFLARPQPEIEAFVRMYEEFKIPFWFNTRPENITEERLALLRRVNCDRISVGLEHGNEEFRRTVLLRQVSNKKLLKHFEALASGGIAFSINNMIGFPGETREMIFETVEFSRQLSGFDTITVSIFTPYNGTRLRQVAVDMGYLDPDTITTHTTSSSLLRMPQLSVQEIDGLMRTFTMHVQFDREMRPRIRRAEEFTEEGEREFADLQRLFQERFLSGDQTRRSPKPPPPDWEEALGHMSKTYMR